MDYKKAGVDIEAGYKSVELMKEHVKKTLRPEVLGGLGGFSGAFSLAKIKEMEEPVLLSGTDGCGTKVKLAMIMDKHDTIGIDAVAMCVNDIACAGGEPLFFLDYIACGKNYPEKIASIVKGVAEGCLQSEAALIGGETAEHPGLMPEDEYDLAGFAVGVCDKKDMITGEDLKAGDVLIGMASSGVHSNGFSLVRKVFEMTKENLETYHESLGCTLGEALLAPTRIYVKALKIFLEATKGKVQAILIGNDMGSQRGLMISPKLVKEFVIPGAKKLVEVAHSYGVKVVYHSCGSIVEAIPFLIEAGVDIIHPIQALAAGMDPQNLKDKFEGQVSFCGGVDTQELLPNGTPEQVAAKVKELRTIFPTGLIISPSHEGLQDDVPPQNIKAMFDEVNKIY